MRRDLAAALGELARAGLTGLGAGEAEDRHRGGLQALRLGASRTGRLTGFDIDITNALCKQMGVECEIVNQSFDGLIPALKVKKIDAIIASMSITDDRKKAIDFAGPYYNVPALFIAPKDCRDRADARTG